MFTATHSLFVSYFLSSVFDEIAFLSYGGRAVPDYDEEDCSGYDMPEQCAFHCMATAGCKGFTADDTPPTYDAPRVNCQLKTCDGPPKPSIGNT